jgi:predicted MFS family arabinose efflux permease
MHALLPAIVREGELPSAVALNSLPFTIARGIGPALGALIASTLGPAAAFGAAAVTHAVFALAMTRIVIRHIHRPTGRDRRIRAALHYLRADRPTVLLMLGVTALGIGVDPSVTLTPSLARDLGGGAGLVGVLASAFGVGAGGAYLVLRRWRERFGLASTAVTGLCVFAAATVLLALSTIPELSVTAFVLCGTGMTFALTSQTTLIQQRVPENLRGRVMAIWSVAYLGSRPLAAAYNGAVADAVSVTAALLSVAIVLAVGAWFVRLSRVQP